MLNCSRDVCVPTCSQCCCKHTLDGERPAVHCHSTCCGACGVLVVSSGWQAGDTSLRHRMSICQCCVTTVTLTNQKETGGPNQTAQPCQVPRKQQCTRMLLSQTVLGQLHKHCLSCWHATAATTSTPRDPILHMKKSHAKVHKTPKLQRIPWQLVLLTHGLHCRGHRTEGPKHHWAYY